MNRQFAGWLVLLFLLIGCAPVPQVPTTLPIRATPIQATPDDPEITAEPEPPPGSQLTPIPTLGAETRWVEPQANRSLIILRPSASGGQAVYRLNPKGEPPTRLANFGDEITRAKPSPDGKFLAVHSVKRAVGPTNDRLELLALDNLTRHLVVQDSLIWALEWSPKGDQLAISLFRQNTSLCTEIYDLNAKKFQNVFELGGDNWTVVGAGQKKKAARTLSPLFHPSSFIPHPSITTAVPLTLTINMPPPPPIEIVS